MVEYPGYGLSPGSASSDGVDRHVRAAYEHFTVTLGVRSERIVIFGASVGTGPACRLAAQVQAAGGRVGALILQSPFTCVRDAAAALVGSVAYVIWERWDNAAALREVACPLLIVHGTADDVIPFSQGVALRQLREDAKLPVVFHAQAGATHNNYRAREDLSVPIAYAPAAARRGAAQRAYRARARSRADAWLASRLPVFCTRHAETFLLKCTARATRWSSGPPSRRRRGWRRPTERRAAPASGRTGARPRRCLGCVPLLRVALQRAR